MLDVQQYRLHCVFIYLRFFATAHAPDPEPVVDRLCVGRKQCNEALTVRALDISDERFVCCHLLLQMKGVNRPDGAYYGDMSRLVVSWLANTDPNQLSIRIRLS